MREIIVDFTADIPIAPGTIIGRQGENNATALKIKIPTEMLNNEDIEMVSLAAQIGAGYVARSEFISKAETVTVKLDSRMTAVNSLSIQLEGYDGAKSLIIKSTKIDNLIFEKSVSGETPELNNDSDIISSIAANTAARHTHSNTDTLGKLGDSNGRLTYDGKPVGGDARTVIEETFTEEYGDFAFVLTASDTYPVKNAVLTVASDSITENTEIKSIKIRFSGKTDYIDVKDIPIKYNGYFEPCIVSAFHPVADDGSESFVVGFKVASLYFPVDCKAYIDIRNGSYSAVKVEYYGG